MRRVASKEAMKYLRLNSLDPYLNLAIEEYLFKNSDEDVIMLWQNGPSVVVGKNQNIRAEVDIAALKRLGIKPVRRTTGGGAVYHDGGNINYSFICHSAGDGIDFARFSEPIIAAIGALGVSLSLSGRNDLCLEDGRKVSGGAQTREGERVLHHGTLLFNTDLDVLGKVLTPDEEKLKTKAIKSTKARVANLCELLPVGTAAELMDLIEKHVIRSMGAEIMDAPTPDDVSSLCERNASDAWLYPTRGIGAECTLKRKRRYPFGTVQIELSYTGERISDANISGDFFGAREVVELSDMLIGHTDRELAELLDDGTVGSCISGMTAAELLQLIYGE